VSELVLHQFGGDLGVESGSPFCVKVHRVLGLKGLAYTVRDVGSPGQLKRLNPGPRKVPVLSYDGELIADSSRIAAVLDERHPDPPLWPRDPVARARARLIEDWADEALYWFAVHERWALDANFVPFSKRVFGKMPPPLRWLVPRFARKQALAQLHGQGLGRLAPDAVHELLAGHVAMLTTLLGDQPMLTGDQLTLADIAVFAPLRALAVAEAHPGSAAIVRSSAPLVAWLGRVDEATRGEHAQAFAA